MTLQQRIGRSVVRRNRKLLKRLPSLEIIEPRVLLAAGPGFVQGFDLNSSNVGIPNATVTLTNTSNNQSISTMTNGVGYYAFNGVAPGTYDVTQTAANYVQSGVDIQTTVNPASALPDNGGIQVTVLNLGVPPTHHRNLGDQSLFARQLSKHKYIDQCTWVPDSCFGNL